MEKLHFVFVISAPKLENSSSIEACFCIIISIIIIIILSEWK